MTTIASRLLFPCLAAAMLHTHAAAAPDAAPAPHDAAEQKTGESVVQLPAGYRWVVPPQPFDLDTMEEISITLEGVGEVVVEPIIEKGMINEVRLGYERGRTESRMKTPTFMVRFADASGEAIRNGPIGIRIHGAAVQSVYHINSDEVLSRAAWFGVAVLDYEGRVERAKAYADAPETENYRVPFLPVVGQPFEFDLPTLDGERMTHQDMLGKIVVYDAWASWCGPCLTKMPEMHKLRERFAAQGVEFVGISLEQPSSNAMARATEKIESLELDWPHLHGFPSREANRLWFNVTGIEGIPRLFVVDRSGILRAEPPTTGRLADAIHDLLEQQPPHAAAGD
ncbi:MAG: TlpA family protein disulfide reductase [Phycisphaerales bacterium]|nr:TlpA family protein disulfide reductase [Phycisphaerales bacterium]